MLNYYKILKEQKVTFYTNYITMYRKDNFTELLS